MVTLGMKSEAQRSYLKELGCLEVQGYLTGRPMPISSYAELTTGIAPAWQFSSGSPMR